MQYIFLHFILYSLNYILIIKCININYTPNSINPVNCVEDGFVKIANCKIWFSVIIFSNLATVFVDSEELMSRAILIGTTPPGKDTGVPEKEFWDRALQPVNDLDDGIVLFFEPKSESSKNAAKLSFRRIAQRTDDLDTPVSKECWYNQKKAIEDFHEDKYNILEEFKKSTIPT